MWGFPGLASKEDAMVEEGFDARHDYCPDSVREDAAGWVLGVLDPAEARRFAEHLLTCRVCQLTVTELQPAARALLTLSSLEASEHLPVVTMARIRQASSQT
jgi:hypothetical protein